MGHLPVLIQDLALILISAGIMTLLFKWMKQPVVLGYIVAGLLAGPHLFGKSIIGDPENIKVWGELGVIFLLFALGLEFSFKKLLNMGATSFIGALTIVLGMMTTGYLTGIILGWGTMNSLFLGGMLAMSSTTIVFKALDDMGLRGQSFANVVFGILIVEDLFAVVLMVMLSTVAVKRTFEGGEMAGSVVKLVGYLLIWFIGGIYLIPTILKRLKRFLNDETFLLISLGLCLGMVLLASIAGFSAALGAFVMGSILAETIEAERIEKLVKPVKDLFGAVFFVSVGMLIEPALLLEYWFPITMITLVVIFGQIVFAGTGILLSGKPLKIAIQSGFALAQIGEFAFIIAGLGLTLKVTDSFIYPVIVAVSFVTTFLTPYIIRLSDKAYILIERKIPVRGRLFLERYSSGFNNVRHKSTWNKLLKALLRIVLIYGMTASFITFLFMTYVSPFIMHVLDGIKGKILSLTIILLLISPFLRAIMMKKNRSEEFMELWNDNTNNKGKLVGLVLIRIIACVGFVMFIISKLFNITYGIIFVISVCVVAIFILSKQIKFQSIQLERHFMRNLSAREVERERNAPVKKKFVRSLLAKDIHLADFEVLPDSLSVGLSLGELDFRRKAGVNVVKIIRGDININIPGASEILYPYDKIVVAGTDKQIFTFNQFIEERKKNASKSEDKIVNEVGLEQFVVEENSYFIGRSIMNSGIRDKGACLVIGIERGNMLLKNPDPSEVFQEGDKVLVAGEREKLEALFEEVENNGGGDNDDTGWVIMDI